MRVLPAHSRRILRAIYESTLVELKNPARSRIFLSGGRGMGKTFLLEELAEVRAQAMGTEVPIIDGRDWAAAIQQLARRRAGRIGEGAAGSTLDLLLDDLDRLIVAAGAQEDGTFEDLIAHLSDLISALPAEGRLCIITSRFSASRMIQLLEGLESRQARDRKSAAVIAAFSILIQMYDNVPINPWPTDWRERIGIDVRDFLQRLPGPQLEHCKELLIKLTGGHPALLVPALSQLAAKAKTTDLTSETSDLAPETRDLTEASPAELKLIIEDAAHRGGIGILRRALNGLREAEREEWRGAYEDLLRLAKPGAAAPSRRSREILVGEGLLFRDDEPKLQYVIPGEILRGELLGEPMGPLQMEVEPDPQKPDAHGNLRVWDHQRVLRIPLSGGAWSVLKTIFEDPARVVSLDNLCERTHLTKENAVRSAIQRLISDARAAGVENILDNLYGKGYRKGQAPSWI